MYILYTCIHNPNELLIFLMTIMKYILQTPPLIWCCLTPQTQCRLHVQAVAGKDTLCDAHTMEFGWNIHTTTSLTVAPSMSLYILVAASRSGTAMATWFSLPRDHSLGGWEGSVVVR